eukprot:gene20053-22020_t
MSASTKKCNQILMNGHDKLCKKSLLDRYLEEQEIYNDCNYNDVFLPEEIDNNNCYEGDDDNNDCYEDGGRTISRSQITIQLSDEDSAINAGVVGDRGMIRQCSKQPRMLNRRNKDANVCRIVDSSHLNTAHDYGISKSMDEAQFVKLGLQRFCSSSTITNDDERKNRNDYAANNCISNPAYTSDRLVALRPGSQRRLSTSSNGFFDLRPARKPRSCSRPFSTGHHHQKKNYCDNNNNNKLAAKIHNRKASLPFAGIREIRDYVSAAEKYHTFGQDNDDIDDCHSAAVSRICAQSSPVVAVSSAELSSPLSGSTNMLRRVSLTSSNVSTSSSVADCCSSDAELRSVTSSTLSAALYRLPPIRTSQNLPSK